jgi:hypothetical protein
VKSLIPIALFFVATSPCLSDVTGSYVARTPTDIAYLQLLQAGNGIDGSLRVISSASTMPGYSVNEVNVTGTAHGQSVFVRVDSGWLGKSNLLSGTRNGSSLTIDFPRADGGITSLYFLRASSAEWNVLVTGFETRMRRLCVLRYLTGDYDAAVSAYRRDNAGIGTDLVKLQAVVDDFDLAHVNEAKAEGLVDQANDVNERNKAAMATAQSGMDASQSAMNVDQAAANANQSAYEKYMDAYQADENAYKSDENAYQSAATAYQSSSADLYAAENSSRDSLWRITDGIWDDIAQIGRLHTSILTEEDDARTVSARGRNDRAAILQVAALLKTPSSIAKVDYASETAIEQGLKKLDAQLAAIIPAPPFPLTTDTGEVAVGSAAVRNYTVRLSCAAPFPWLRHPLWAVVTAAESVDS